MIHTCMYAIKLWGGHPLHLLTMRECEVIMGLLPKCLPTSVPVLPMCEVIVGSLPKCLQTSVPVLPVLLRAIVYFLQYLQSFPPIVRLFYLT